MSVEQAIAIADPTARAAALAQVVSTAAATANISNIKRAVDAIIDETTPTGAIRTVLTQVVTVANTVLDDIDQIEDVVNHTLDRLRPRISQLEDVDFQLRDALAKVYVGIEDHLRAAALLSAARVDGPLFTDAERCAFWVRCAFNFVAGEDDVSAERWVRKANDVVYKLDDPMLLMKFKNAYAQLLDQKRRFQEAALRYLELMRQAAVVGVPDSDMVSTLSKAATCAILAPAGPQRQRVMQTLMRDERIGAIPAAIYGMLGRMYNERFIMPAELAAFVSTLASHQKATGQDGMTVVQRAVLEHNLLAASKVYKNVSFVSLSYVLGVDAARAEKIAAKMLSEGRIMGTIDQVDGVLDFAAADAKGASGGKAGAMKISAGGGASGGAGSTAAAAGGAGSGSSSAIDALVAWDASIKEACMLVNEVYDAVGKAHPSLVEHGEGSGAASSM